MVAPLAGQLGGGSGSVTPGTTPATGATGSVLFIGAAVVQQDNANFFWDDTNNRLGLGINASLNAKLHAAPAASEKGILVKMNATTPGNPLEVQPSGSTTPYFYVDASGFAYIGDSSVSTQRQVVVRQMVSNNLGALYSGAVSPTDLNYSLAFGSTLTRLNAPTTGTVEITINNTLACASFDENNTAGNTRMFVYDVNGAALKRVSVGANDSGGAGFKLLRVAN